MLCVRGNLRPAGSLPSRPSNDHAMAARLRRTACATTSLFVRTAGALSRPPLSPDILKALRALYRAKNSTRPSPTGTTRGPPVLRPVVSSRVQPRGTPSHSSSRT
jgi:hypothetical protein